MTQTDRGTAPDNERETVMEKLLLTPEETAELMGIGRSTLYELLRAGAIESIRVGGCRRVPRGAVDEFIERLRAEAGKRISA